MANCHRAVSTVPKTAPAIGGVLSGVVDTTTRSRSPSQPLRPPCRTSPAASLDQGPQAAGTTVTGSPEQATGYAAGPASVRRTGPGVGRARGAGSGVGVAPRVLLLPAPRVGAHLVDGALGPPAELGVGARGVGEGHRDVAGATGDHLVGQLAADRALEGVQHLEHARARAGAEVPGADGLVGAGQLVQRRDVAGGEV